MGKTPIITVSENFSIDLFLYIHVSIVNVTSDFKHSLIK